MTTWLTFAFFLFGYIVAPPPVVAVVAALVTAVVVVLVVAVISLRGVFVAVLRSGNIKLPQNVCHSQALMLLPPLPHFTHHLVPILPAFHLFHCHRLRLLGSSSFFSSCALWHVCALVWQRLKHLMSSNLKRVSSSSSNCCGNLLAAETVSICESVREFAQGASGVFNGLL